MKYLLKANHDLLLPDGKTKVKDGETFEWDRPIDVFGKCVAVVEEKEDPVKDGDGVQPMTTTQIRARAKELKIPNYSREDVEALKVKIAVAEAEAAGKDPEQGDEKPVKDGDEGKTPDEGNANAE